MNCDGCWKNGLEIGNITILAVYLNPKAKRGMTSLERKNCNLMSRALCAKLISDYREQKLKGK